MNVMNRLARNYLASHRASPTFRQYHIILRGDLVHVCEQHARRSNVKVEHQQFGIDCEYDKYRPTVL